MTEPLGASAQTVESAAEWYQGWLLDLILELSSENLLSVTFHRDRTVKEVLS